jgi:hypothetical protein
MTDTNLDTVRYDLMSADDWEGVRDAALALVEHLRSSPPPALLPADPEDERIVDELVARRTGATRKMVAAPPAGVADESAMPETLRCHRCRGLILARDADLGFRACRECFDADREPGAHEKVRAMMTDPPAIERVDGMQSAVAGLDGVVVKGFTPPEMFMGVPDRWFEGKKFRCVNGHVSTTLLKSEALGGTVCLSCQGHVMLTFPEDVDGSVVGAEVFAARYAEWQKSNDPKPPAVPRGSDGDDEAILWSNVKAWLMNTAWQNGWGATAEEADAEDAFDFVAEFFDGLAAELAKTAGGVAGSCFEGYGAGKAEESGGKGEARGDALKRMAASAGPLPTSFLAGSPVGKESK